MIKVRLWLVGINICLCFINISVEVCGALKDLCFFLEVPFFDEFLDCWMSLSIGALAVLMSEVDAAANSVDGGDGTS